jgi:hypothetical protein
MPPYQTELLVFSLHSADAILTFHTGPVVALKEFLVLILLLIIPVKTRSYDVFPFTQGL